MSTDADTDNPVATVRGSPHSVFRYDRFMQVVHWTTFLVLTATFAAAWLVRYADTREQANGLVQLHRALGLTALFITACRLLWRFVARIPPLPPDLPPLQRLAARINEYALYALLLLQPTLGFLYSSASRTSVVVSILGAIPSPLTPDRNLARLLFTAHGLARCLLGLIALHVAAALFHHFVRGDDVLVAMLPRRRPPRTDTAGSEAP